MERTEIQNKVIEIIAHLLKISKTAITEESTLESLGADSLNRVEFVIELEDVFNIEINDEETEKLDTVKNIVDYVQRLKAS